MAKKINFAMTDATSVAMIESAGNAIFAHSMEQLALAKAKKNAVTIVDKAIEDTYGTISALNDAIRREEVEDAELVEAVRTIGRVDYKRHCLSVWYKDKIASYTEYFKLDDIIEELGANDLEKGVKAVADILNKAYGLEKVSVALRNKFARRIYSAMDGQRKSTNTSVTKGTLLNDRSRREIKEVGLRAMCEYISHTTDITLKTKEDYAVEFKYDDALTTVVDYEIKNI